PAVAHEGYACALAPLLRAEQLVMLNPGHTGGSLHFAASLRAAGGPAVAICESVTLAYICRLEGPATVGVYRETATLRFAALPAPAGRAHRGDRRPHASPLPEPDTRGQRACHRAHEHQRRDPPTGYGHERGLAGAHGGRLSLLPRVDHAVGGARDRGRRCG